MSTKLKPRTCRSRWIHAAIAIGVALMVGGCVQHCEVKINYCECDICPPFLDFCLKWYLPSEECPDLKKASVISSATSATQCNLKDELRDLAEEIARLVRTNPALMTRALPATVSWSPVLEELEAGRLDQVVISEGMAMSAQALLDGLIEFADEPLATRLRELATAVDPASLVGLTGSEVLDRLSYAIKSQKAMQPTVSLAAQERGLATAGRSVVIPAAAHVRGARGTNWRTDLMVLNPGTTPAVFIIALLPLDTVNDAPEELVMFLEGHESALVPDVLEALFEFTGAASLRVTADSGAVVVTSRTYNLLGAGNDLGLPAGSTFGQFMPALTDDDAIASGDAGHVIHLAHDPSLAQGNRTNLILVNGANGTITLEVSLFRGDGTLLGTVTRTLRSWEYDQLNKVFEEVTSDTIENGYAVVRPTTAGGRVFALATVVDNLTGDPIAIPASLNSVQKAMSGSLFDIFYIPAAAHLKGAKGTNWRTELVLNTQSSNSVGVDVVLLPRDQENIFTDEEWFTVMPGESIRVDDLLATTFDFEGAAALRIRPRGPITASSRTYNLLGSGNGLGLPEGSTFGQYAAPIALLRALEIGDNGLIQHLSHDPSLQEGSRTNLILVNGANTTIDVEIELYEGDGVGLGAFTTSLRKFEYKQFNKVFERVTSQKVDGGYAVVRTTTSFGRLFAQASVVDNRTGDPINVDAVAVRTLKPLGLIATVNTLFGTLGTGGFDMRAVFELLTSGDLQELLDDNAADLPGYITRTANGIVIDLGSSSPLEGGFAYGGKLGLSFSGFDGGGGAEGNIAFDFDGFNVDGRSAIVDHVDAGFDLESADGDRVTGTITLGSSGGKALTDLTGNLEYDTSRCPTYPIDGSITVTVDGEQRTVDFSDRCDGGFDLDIPSAEFYRSILRLRNCAGEWQPTYQIIHLVAEDGELAADPGGPPPDRYGSRRYTATGHAGIDASLEFAELLAGSSDGVQRSGWFRGERRSGGDTYYYVGEYGYTADDGGCSSSYYHGPEDFDAFGVLETCDGRCTE